MSKIYLVIFVSSLTLSCLLSRFEWADPMNLLFIHLPAAWLSLIVYVILGLSSLIYLITRNPLLILFSLSLIPYGLMLTWVTLITGSLWGKMTWGTYWVWDGRLISVLVLGMMYLLTKEFLKLGGREGSWICVIGLLNLPIVKWSVDWWSSLHQSSSVTTLSSEVSEVFWIPIVLWLIVMSVVGMKGVEAEMRVLLSQKLSRNLSESMEGWRRR